MPMRPFSVGFECPAAGNACAQSGSRYARPCPHLLSDVPCLFLTLATCMLQSDYAKLQARYRALKQSAEQQEARQQQQQPPPSAASAAGPSDGFIKLQVTKKLYSRVATRHSLLSQGA